MTITITSLYVRTHTHTLHKIPQNVQYAPRIYRRLKVYRTFTEHLDLYTMFTETVGFSQNDDFRQHARLTGVC